KRETTIFAVRKFMKAVSRLLPQLIEKWLDGGSIDGRVGRCGGWGIRFGWAVRLRAAAEDVAKAANDTAAFLVHAGDFVSEAVQNGPGNGLDIQVELWFGGIQRAGDLNEIGQRRIFLIR